MKSNDIRNLIAKGRLESAITKSVELTNGTELNNLALGISNRFRNYKKNSIAGILDNNEENKTYALLTHQVLDLLNEYELYQIKELKLNVDKLTDELKTGEPAPESDEVILELGEISREMQQMEEDGSTFEKKQGVLNRIQIFIEKAQQPDSSYNKTIKMVQNGYGILQDVAAGYNSLAEWLAMPQIPRVFLKKES